MSRVSKVLGRLMEDEELPTSQQTDIPTDPYEGMSKKKLEEQAAWMEEMEKVADKALEVLRELSSKSEEKETRAKPFAQAVDALMMGIRAWADECKSVEHMASAEDHKS